MVGKWGTPQWVSIDTSISNNEYAKKDYTKSMYESYLEGCEKANHSNSYRNLKNQFATDVFHDLNSRIADYTFGVKNNLKSNLESDITVLHGGISIDNKGKGKQCFIKADFALRRNGGGHDIMLFEATKNHLSHEKT